MTLSLIACIFSAWWVASIDSLSKLEGLLDVFRNFCVCKGRLDALRSSGRLSICIFCLKRNIWKNLFILLSKLSGKRSSNNRVWGCQIVLLHLINCALNIGLRASNRISSVLAITVWIGLTLGGNSCLIGNGGYFSKSVVSISRDVLFKSQSVLHQAHPLLLIAINFIFTSHFSQLHRKTS